MSDRGLALGASTTVGADGVVKESGAALRVGGDGLTTDLGGTTGAAADPLAPARPAWLPPGYDTPEAFRAAVDNGTYALGTAAAAQTPEQIAAATAAADLAAVQQQNQTGVETIPPEVLAKMAPYTKEFGDTGTLSAAAKAQAAKDFNVPESAVDIYMEGLKSRQASTVTPFLEVTGGQDGYTAFQAWAPENLSQEEMATYNEALAKAPNVAKVLLKGHFAKFQAQGNSQVRDITAGRSSTPGVQGDTYASMAQVVSDMDNPKYRSDPAYRQAVEQKIARSQRYLG